MTLRGKDREFRHPGITYLDFKQVEMDRVVTAFTARLWHQGLPSRLGRSTDLPVDTFVDAFLELSDLFSGFERETTRHWLETHLLDMVNRGKPSAAVAGPRPLHGFAYRFRNTRRSRPYGADEQLYEMIFHARDGKGPQTLMHLKNFFFPGIDMATETQLSDTEIDVETQALLHLTTRYRKIEDRPDASKPRRSCPPLCLASADLLANDIMRLLFHKDLIPRTVMVDYVKLLFSFHLALYHLRLLKLLPALVAAGPDPVCGSGRCPTVLGSMNADCRYGMGLFLDVTGLPDAPAAKLAERSAGVWYGRIPEFIQAAFTMKKLDEFAENQAKRTRLRRPPAGFFSVGDALGMLKKSWDKDREAYFNARVGGVTEDSGGDDAERGAVISQILQLGLDNFTTYIEILTAFRGAFHRKYITECLDSLLLKNRDGAMIAQPRGGARRFVMDSRLLEVLLQISLLGEGGALGFHTVPLRIDEFLGVLRRRYGLYIDRLPGGDGFGEANLVDQAALRANSAAFTSRLREIGFYSDLSDAYLTQTITPRYVITEDGSVGNRTGAVR